MSTLEKLITQLNRWATQELAHHHRYEPWINVPKDQVERTLSGKLKRRCLDCGTVKYS